MKETSVSQIPHSLSLPSEPPDITNWFPSYKYESFVLDTYDGVGGSQFREGETERCVSTLVGGIDKEKEGLWDDSERNCHNNDDKFEGKSCTKMLDSLYSASLLSEPPHIKNWFSSYEYQSPMSDEDNLKVSATQESDSDKDEYPMKGRQSEKEENFVEFSSGRSDKEGEGEEVVPNRYLLKDSLGDVAYENPCCKIPDCSELSELSGQPDVGNWFSSCAYESPDMDENSELVIGETEFEEDQFANRRIKKDKEMEFQKLGQSRSAGKEALDLKVPLDVDLGFDSHSQDANLDNECEENEVLGKDEFSSQDILCGKRVHCLNDACANPDTNLAKDTEISRLSDERPQLEQKQTRKFPGKPGFVSLKTEVKLSSRDDESPSKLIYEQNENVESNPANESTSISSRNNYQHIQVAVASTRKATPKFNNKKNGEEECLSNGFVTTKKKRIVRSMNENSLGRQAEILLPCSKNKRTWLEGDQDKNGGVRRKVLSERTNFGQTAAAMEVTGKWKCPHKSKPIIGPPLKQLRLEQWVCRRQ